MTDRTIGKIAVNLTITALLLAIIAMIILGVAFAKTLTLGYLILAICAPVLWLGLLIATWPHPSEEAKTVEQLGAHMRVRIPQLGNWFVGRRG